MHSSIRKPASEYVDYQFVTTLSKIIYTLLSTGLNQEDSKDIFYAIQVKLLTMSDS